ncbi:Neopullulanase [bioreactor metagenome]|uniref:Neopullulanase n=1 Tax=bioreactor metagenome TaxID=1076179 RepID=A0A645AL03_9ZZZZ
MRGDVYDGVTNYRLRDILLDYVHTTVLDAEDFGYELTTLLAAHGGAAPAMLNLLDSHDTTRILTTLKGDADKLRILLTLQMTLPGAPMIYYGDEVGLLGETDPDCRRTFPWDETQWNARVTVFTRELIALRHAYPALRHGSPEVLGFFNGVLAYRMAAEGDEAIVVVNPREAIAHLDLPLTSASTNWQQFDGGQRYSVSGGALHLPLVPACSAQVLLPG